MNEEDLAERLDKLIAVVSLAFADEIAHARDKARADPVVAAILDSCEAGWTPAATVRSAAQRAGASKATFGRRAGELVGSGAIKRRGATTSIEYRSTGVF